MRRIKKKAKISLGTFLLLAVFFALAPRSLAEDLIAPVIAAVDALTPASNSPQPALPAQDVIPTAPDPVSTQGALPISDSNAQPTNSSAPTEAATLNPAATPSITPSPSPSPTPAYALASQSALVHVPNSVLVDPRARAAFLPILSASGPTNLLVCFNSSATIPIISRLSDSVMSANLFTENSRISGPTWDVVRSINGAMGLQIRSNGPGLAGHTQVIRFVAVSEPTVNPALCNSASASNTRTISFTSIDIGLNMVKANVNLK